MNQLDANFVVRRDGNDIHFTHVGPACGSNVTALLGPSGGGKTTVLRAIAGLDRPSAGRIRFGNDVWFDQERNQFIPANRRSVGFCFQRDALFPHLTVRQNIGFAISKHANRNWIIDDLIERFELVGLGDRRTDQISGGQRSRVAIARTIAVPPRLLLLDEPFASLDPALRQRTRQLLAGWIRSASVPVLLVTHDCGEAISMAGDVIVMSGGQILQSGSTEEVFSRPKTTAVANIVGVESILTGEVVSLENGLAKVRVGNQILSAAADPARFSRAISAVHLCIHGDDVTLTRQTTADATSANQSLGQHSSDAITSSQNRLSGEIESIDIDGGLVRVVVSLDHYQSGSNQATNRHTGPSLTATITRASRLAMNLGVGDAVIATVKATAIHVVNR